MDTKDELEYLCSLPVKIDEGEISVLKVSQVLTFLKLVDCGSDIHQFLLKEHNLISKGLIDLYQVSLNLLSLPEDLKRDTRRPYFGDKLPSSSQTLTIFPTLLEVSKISRMSLREVLDMPITHYNLCLYQIKDNYNSQKKAFEKAKSKGKG